MSRAIKFGKTVKEIRLHLCQTSTSSQGVRDFIEKSYVEIKKTNPSVPFLIRECQGVQPKLWARLCDGKEQCINLKDHNEEQVFGQLAKVAVE